MVELTGSKIKQRLFKPPNEYLYLYKALLPILFSGLWLKSSQLCPLSVDPSVCISVRPHVILLGVYILPCVCSINMVYMTLRMYVSTACMLHRVQVQFTMCMHSTLGCEKRISWEESQ